MSKQPLYKSFKHPSGVVGLPRHVFLSDAYRHLSVTARCVLDELQNLYMPSRNGRIGLSVANAAKSLGLTEKTVGKAFHELIRHGFIERMLDANYSKGITREWRLTFQPHNGREPTDEWRHWKEK